MIWKLCPRLWTRISATLSIWLPDNVLMVHNHQSTAFQQCNHIVNFLLLDLFPERLDSNLGFLHSLSLCVVGGYSKARRVPNSVNLCLFHMHMQLFFLFYFGNFFQPKQFTMLPFPSGRKKHLLIAFLVFYFFSKLIQLPISQNVTEHKQVSGCAEFWQDDEDVNAGDIRI